MKSTWSQRKNGIRLFMICLFILRLTSLALGQVLVTIDDSGKEIPATRDPEIKEAEFSMAPETQKERLALNIGGWQAGLSGNISALGMTLDLKNGTNLGKQEKGAIKGNWQISKRDLLNFSGNQFDHTGALTQQTVFDRITYGQGASIRVKTTFLDVGFGRVMGSDNKDSIKFLYGLKSSQMLMRLRQKREGELSQKFTTPYLGIEGTENLSKCVALSGSGKVFSLNRNNLGGRLTDLEIGLHFGSSLEKEQEKPLWNGVLGFRYFLCRGDLNNEATEIILSGPTLGIEGRF
ncbi:hypothetical protein AUK22_11490 [bacterium CG2_30_54_10]|nr:MAG: hypothetical protein AUK22_11490 [bacterium CG2_30_54_10]